jgi:hypothetical protein
MFRHLFVASVAIASAADAMVALAQSTPTPMTSTTPATPAAQSIVPATTTLTLQPVSVILGFYSAEIEHAVAPSATVGVGASYFSGFPGDNSTDFHYLSSEAKVRYYPGSRPFQGFSFGGTLGFTRVSQEQPQYDANMVQTSTTTESRTGVKAGFELDYGWLLGTEQRFVVALGAGAKRLFISDFPSNGGDKITAAYPTLRVSVGFAF